MHTTNCIIQGGRIYCSSRTLDPFYILVLVIPATVVLLFTIMVIIDWLVDNDENKPLARIVLDCFQFILKKRLW